MFWDFYNPLVPLDPKRILAICKSFPKDGSKQLVIVKDDLLGVYHFHHVEAFLHHDWIFAPETEIQSQIMESRKHAQKSMFLLERQITCNLCGESCQNFFYIFLF